MTRGGVVTRAPCPLNAYAEENPNGREPGKSLSRDFDGVNETISFEKSRRTVGERAPTRADADVRVTMARIHYTRALQGVVREKH